MFSRRDAWFLGLIALVCVVLTIDDPGITMDEPLDVVPGRKYVETLLKKPVAVFFDRKTVDFVYFDNAEHPLGRWLLGLASRGFQWAELIALGRDPLVPPAYVRAGRMAPACCFAILVGLVSSWSGRRYGRPAGWAAGFGLAVMPRVFAHAHFGALDTFVALFWTLALVKAVEATEAERPIRAMAFAGFFFGLALLTKIHGWLLPPVMAAWTLYRLPMRRAIPALFLWGLVGFAVFFVGWPWLWYDPVGRLGEYLQRGVVRVPAKVLYFGTVYVDRDVPWHYPWFYFAVTVPMGLHLLGGLGVWFGRRDRFVWVLLGAMVFLLVLFSTRVAVYDGERLFLAVFPLWGVLIGRGFGGLWIDLSGRSRLRAALVVAVMAQAIGVVAIHPFGLSYYNGLVFGLRGAERLGLELTFWGDTVDRRLLETLARDAAPGDAAALAPTLVVGQGHVATTRTLARRGIGLEDQEALPQAEWIVVYRREAYWSPEIRRLVQGPPVSIRSREGVWLSGIWKNPGRPLSRP